MPEREATLRVTPGPQDTRCNAHNNSTFANPFTGAQKLAQISLNRGKDITIQAWTLVNNSNAPLAPASYFNANAQSAPLLMARITHHQPVYFEVAEVVVKTQPDEG